MKTLNISIGLVLVALLCGCAKLSVVKKDAAGNETRFIGFSLFSNSAFKNLGVEASTKTTTNLLKVSTASTEPNPESITATGTALGEMIGQAAKTAAKP